jgi:tripartite-type tricarboxylate transporter receptor subunit TctC
MRIVPLAAVFAALAAPFAGLAAVPAADYPVRPIRVIVPYPPGGITDVVSRIAAQEMNREFGQNVIVDNRPGANSILGVELVAKATPDGYTLGTVIAAHAANQTLYPKLPYNSVTSFAQISLIGTAPLIMCVTNSLPATNVKEVIAIARAKPGQLSFASSGIGAAAHLSTELLMSMTAIKMVHVPYKGTAPALQDLIGGQIQVMFDTVSSMMPQARAGRIRAIALAAAERSGAAPDVPTFIESGVPGYVAGTWVGMHAPAGTPASIAGSVSAAIAKGVRRPEVRERFQQLGIDAVGNTPAEYTAFLKDEVAKWAKVIREANVKLEQ